MINIPSDSDDDAGRIPSARTREPAIPVVPVENIMPDLWARGAALTEANRAVVAGALQNRRLAYCGLCLAPAAAIGTFTLQHQFEARKIRVLVYGVCAPCRDQPDYETRVEARISATGSIGYSVDLDLAPGRRHDSRTLERAEWIKQFPETVRELLWDRVSRPEQYGLDVCSCCQSLPMAMFGFYPEFRAADGTRHMLLYSLCFVCHMTDGHDRMEARAQSRGAAGAEGILAWDVRLSRASSTGVPS